MNRPLKHVAAFVCAGLLAIAAITPARGDAIPPPPKNCPRGTIPTSSHAGARCEVEAPKDCPTGWTGALGGSCILMPCDTDAQCTDGAVCVPHSVCLSSFEDSYYDYNETPPTVPTPTTTPMVLPPPVPGSLFGADLFAGPMMPKVRRPKPIVRYKAVNLCSREVACSSPNTCQTQKLCVPKGARALAYRGKNADPIRVSRTTDVPLTENTADPTEGTSPIAEAGKTSGGCSRCAIAPTESSPFAWLALTIAAGAFTISRRSRKSA